VRPPRVSVVVLTANRLPCLREAVASLQAQVRQPDELVVVDNGSTDETPAWLSALRPGFPLRVLRRDGSGSFAAARNEGVRGANGDFVAFLDDDCEADPQWLERLLAVALAGDLEAVGGAVLPADRLEYPESFPPEACWAAGLFPEGFFGPEGGRRFLPTTSNLLAARGRLLADPFQEVEGKFEEGVAVYRLGREDAEWWRRMRRLGVPVGVAPRAIVWHHVGQERVEWATLVARAELDGAAHWKRNGSPEALGSALRDVLHAPLAVAGEKSERSIMERWRGAELWVRRQATLLCEAVGADARGAAVPLGKAALREVPAVLASTGKALASHAATAFAPGPQATLRERNLAEIPPRHLVVVLHDFLGDAVLAGPLLRQLEAGLPETEITIAHGPVGGPILRACGLRRARLEQIPAEAVGRSPVSSACLYTFLAGLHPDAVLVTYLHGLAPSPLFALGVPVVGWPHDNGLQQRVWGDLLTHPVQKTQRKHEAAALLDLAAPFGVRTRLERPRLEPRPKSRERIDGILGSAPGPFAVVHLERGGRWKIWPPERIEELVGRMLGVGLSVFLVGSRSDRPLARSMARRLGKGCESLHGVIDSGALVALLARADWFVGCDSGPAHVAQAVGCRTLVLFGGTEPERWGPLPALAGEPWDEDRFRVVRAAPGDWLAEEAEGLPADEPMRLLPIDFVWETLQQHPDWKENFSARVESH